MGDAYFEFMAQVMHAIWITGGQGAAERAQGSAGSGQAALRPSEARGRWPTPRPAGSVAAFLPGKCPGGAQEVGPPGGKPLSAQTTAGAEARRAEKGGESREQGGACQDAAPKEPEPGQPQGRP